MTTNQMEAFLAVASAKSFTKAAKELFMSQSNLSKIIAALEAELQTKLFIKQGNRIELTAAGQVVQAQFLFTLEELRSMRSEISKCDKDHPAIYLAVSSSMCYANLLDPINAYISANPAVEIHLLESYSHLFLDLLEHEDVDLAIGWETASAPNHIDSFLLDEDSWKLAVSREHPLADAKHLDLSAAKNESFILQRGDKRFVAMCQMAGFKPTVRHQVNSIDILTELIGRNYGVGFLCSRMLPSSKADRIRLISLTESSSHNLVVLARKGRSHLLDDFIRFYLSHYQ